MSNTDDVAVSCALEALALEHRAEVLHWQDEVIRLRRVIDIAIARLNTTLTENEQIFLQRYLWDNKAPPDETKEAT